MGLWSALICLAEDWKQEVEPGTRLDYLLELVNDLSAAQSTNLTSNDPARKIADLLETMLEMQGGGVVRAAEEYASQYETSEALLEEMNLECFLREVSSV